MQLNYLILTHKQPTQLARLVARLRSEDTEFFIHVDRKVNIADFQVAVRPSVTVHYVADDDRINGCWGDLSLVDAAMSMYRLALKEGRKGFFVLLSGQDYPIRSNIYIQDYLERHADCNFMTLYPVPDPKKTTENGGTERFEQWTFDCHNPHDARMKAKIMPLSFRPKTLGGFVRLLRYCPSLLPKAFKCWFRHRRYPYGIAKYFNEFWCVLNEKAVKTLVSVFDSRPDLREYYNYTHIPDETLVGSILMSEPLFVQTLQPMCHYICWKGGKNGSPKTITIADIEEMETMKRERPYLLFARKFDADSKVLDIIDQMNKFQ